jgi:hypothetical protein
MAEGIPYSNPTTSFEAAQSMKPHAPTIRQRVFELIASCSVGRTADELEVVTGWRLHTITARITELAQAGRIEDVGERRKTRSGRKAIVWYAR